MLVNGLVKSAQFSGENGHPGGLNPQFFLRPQSRYIRSRRPVRCSSLALPTPGLNFGGVKAKSLPNFARNFAKGIIVNTTLYRKEFRESPACPKAVLMARLAASGSESAMRRCAMPLRAQIHARSAGEAAGARPSFRSSGHAPAPPQRTGSRVRTVLGPGTVWLYIIDQKCSLEFTRVYCNLVINVSARPPGCEAPGRITARRVRARVRPNPPPPGLPCQPHYACKFDKYKEFDKYASRCCRARPLAWPANDGTASR